MSALYRAEVSSPSSSAVWSSRYCEQGMWCSARCFHNHHTTYIMYMYGNSHSSGMRMEHFHFCLPLSSRFSPLFANYFPPSHPLIYSAVPPSLLCFKWTVNHCTCTDVTLVGLCLWVCPLTITVATVIFKIVIYWDNPCVHVEPGNGIVQRPLICDLHICTAVHTSISVLHNHSLSLSRGHSTIQNACHDL